MNRFRESGSVIFYILIGIVLFAALGFAIANMMRSGGGEGGGGNRELRQLQASELLQQVQSIGSAIRSMKIAGIDDSRISFENGIEVGYGNAACSEGSCKLFNADGGGLSYAPPVKNWLDASHSGDTGYGQWLFSGNNDVTGVGSVAPDLLLILPWVNKELCLRLNTMLGIGNPGGDAPKDSGDVDIATKFTGTYTASESIGGGDPEIERQRTGCFQGDVNPAAGTYHFFQVLIAR